MDEDEIMKCFCSNYYDLSFKEKRFIREQVYRRQLHDVHSFSPYADELKSKRKIREGFYEY